jgi:hypothetical protein
MLFAVSVLSNGTQHASVCEAPAQHAAESIADLFIGGVRFFVQSRFRGQDYSTEAEAALGSAFFDKCLLNWVWLLGSSKSLECGDFMSSDGAHRHYARSHSFPVDNYCAGPALRQAATESRSAQSQFVIQDEKKGCLRVDRHRLLVPVHL